MTNRISSPDNRKYRDWQKLLKKKYRDRTGSFLVEETNAISEAVINGADIESFIVRDGDWCNMPDEANEIMHRVPGFTLSAKLFDDLCSTENSRGIMAVIRKRNYSISDFSKGGRSSNILVLDRLQDPGNTGTVIRTADGAGLGGIIVMKGTCDIYSPKVVRASAGSIFRVPFIFVEDNNQLFGILKDAGKSLAVTCFEGAQDYGLCDLSHDTAITIGNEGGGVSQELISKADKKVKIPMYGNIDSLNASVAAGIIMYESERQRKEKVSEDK